VITSPQIALAKLYSRVGAVQQHALTSLPRCSQERKACSLWDQFISRTSYRNILLPVGVSRMHNLLCVIMTPAARCALDTRKTVAPCKWGDLLRCLKCIDWRRPAWLGALTRKEQTSKTLVECSVAERERLHNLSNGPRQRAAAESNARPLPQQKVGHTSYCYALASEELELQAMSRKKRGYPHSFTECTGNRAESRRRMPLQAMSRSICYKYNS
jgi:hypothetical protein